MSQWILSFLWLTILVVVIVINYKNGQNIVLKCNKNVKECEIPHFLLSV